MAGGVLLNISRDEGERARLMSEYKGAVDLQSKLVNERRKGERKGEIKGRLKGRQEGRLEGRLEGLGKGLETAARNALAKGYTFEQVHEITGLDIKTIETLQAQ